MKYFNVISLFLLLMALVAGIIAVNFYHGNVTTELAIYLAYFAPAYTVPTFTIPLISLLVGMIIALIVVSTKFANERLQAEFIRIVTHKFRTPITELRWGIENVGKNISQQEREDLVKRMTQTTTRLLEIVDLMVGAAKFDRRLGYLYERTSLREMVEESLVKHAEFIRQKNLTFKVDSGSAVPHVIIDRRNIQFALDVIVNNAVTYTPTSGTINISFIDDGAMITLVIKDSGIGFTYSESRKLFSQFWRSLSAQKIDTEGMGLGLYTARAIVEAHKGKIWAKSEGPNAGATFYIQLKTEA